MANITVFDSIALRVILARRSIRSLSQLARLAGISEGYVRHIVGGYIPPQRLRERIADALSIAVGHLWREVSTTADQVGDDGEQS